jgi:hypothetical protein
MLVYFVEIWSILRQLDIFYLNSVHFVAIWYIFTRSGILYQEKSGNPAEVAGSDGMQELSHQFCSSDFFARLDQTWPASATFHDRGRDGRNSFFIHKKGCQIFLGT